ncbi:hypothetical protein KKH36_01865 [Patescibacteria group bacterium]|nr:hypothetical protein [Patescibacteria group bacterium]
MITNIGLSIIVIAWIFQLIVSLRKPHTLSTGFIAIYSIGVIFLVIDSFNAGMNTLGNINAISLIASLSALIVNVVKK